MAAVLRFMARQGRSLALVSRAHPPRTVAVPLVNMTLSISTSGKNKDVGTAVEPMEKSAELKRLTEHFADTDVNKEENWTSYGYEPGDRDTDWFRHHMTMFASLTVGFTLIVFISAYMPDLMLLDWGHREAFLELERRERLGLPIIDPDYTKIDVADLPSDEQIGEQEIII